MVILSGLYFCGYTFRVHNSISARVGIKTGTELLWNFKIK
jgi:hypothetical protein